MRKRILVALVLMCASVTGAVGQTVPNGQYYRSTLLCDNGYQDTGGQCRALPPVTNGQYYRSTLLCDNGYQDTDGQCVSAPALAASDGTANGVPVAAACAENGSCVGDISDATGRPKTVQVDGYYRKDGTYVRGHYRSAPSKGGPSSRGRK